MIAAIQVGLCVLGFLLLAFIVWGWCSEEPLKFPPEYTGAAAYRGERSGDLPEVLYDEVMDRARHSLDLRIR